MTDPQKTTLFEISGEWRPLAEWCHLRGAPFDLVRRRLLAGRSLESALGPPSPKAPSLRGALLEFNGQKRTLPEWCKLLGLRYPTVRRRLDRGKSVAEALTAGRVHSRQKPSERHVFFTLNGRTQNLMHWCLEYDVDYSLVYGRLGRGWSLERALMVPSRLAKRTQLSDPDTEIVRPTPPE